MDGWMDEKMEGWMEKQMDGWMDGKTDRWGIDRREGIMVNLTIVDHIASDFISSDRRATR